ncbi:MAG: ABC transporter ATP-binding protein [Bacteroidales bacterium]|nr:ABC transporter ATP-binding protein [Bacteroidales bacterium]
MVQISDKEPGVLEVRALVKKYGELTAVDQLSLQIKQGEVFGILGPNGAGKTTSIGMMCGLLRPDSGEVLIHGEPVPPGGGRAIRSRVGICPQENILWNKLSCFEQLVFSARMYNVPRGLARSRADRLLGEMGLESKRNSLAGTLSGGLKRRLSVIMALMHDPEIMVFDEPEAGLDPQSRVLVRDFIRERARDKTVIVTTHNMDEADRMATRVAIIDMGRLLQVDTPENLKRSIGRGDVMELKLQSGNPAGLDRAAGTLNSLGYKVKRQEDRVNIRAMNLVPRIHEIYRILEHEGIAIQEMKIRENTLEDVFIHLTGKSFRK